MIDEQKEKLIQRVIDAGIEFLNLEFTDVSGTVKLVTIPAGGLRAALEEGVWFDGSAVEGMARVAESDLYLRPDLTTLAILPWEARATARLICDLYLPDRTPFPADPRRALKQALAEATALGYEYRVGCEFEFFVFEEPGPKPLVAGSLEPIDRSGYFDMPEERAEKLCSSTTMALSRIGFDVETTHHEVQPGQQEIDLSETGALEAADAIVMMKCALRAYGQRDNLLVSFMPKPIEGISGSGLHLQQRLVDKRSGANLFHDPAGRYNLSEVGEHFIAGQLSHARGICAVVAPLVNSYKRLTGGAEAPSQISWARSHRGALIRIPDLRLKSGPRVELRNPDPSCNPYLALAAVLQAGLDGIKNGEPIPGPLEQSCPGAQSERYGEALANPLPVTLEEALKALDWDPVVRSALGEPIYERFTAAKTREWLSHQHHISSWELQHYLRGA